MKGTLTLAQLREARASRLSGRACQQTRQADLPTQRPPVREHPARDLGALSRLGRLRQLRLVHHPHVDQPTG